MKFFFTLFLILVLLVLDSMVQECREHCKVPKKVAVVSDSTA